MTQFLASKFRRLESRALPRNEDAKTRTRGLFLIAFGAVVLISALMAGVGMPTGNDLRSFVCEAGVVILIFGLAFLGETPFIRARMAIGDVSLEISREGKSPPVLAGTLYFSPPLRPDQFAQPWDLRVGMDPPYRHARLFSGHLMRFAAQHAVPLFSPGGTTRGSRCKFLIFRLHATLPTRLSIST